jgi:hypothetical protein
MEGLPDNYQDLPPDEQDRILNAKLAGLQARLEGLHTCLVELPAADGDELTYFEKRHLGNIAAATDSVIKGLRDWRAAVGSSAKEKANQPADESPDSEHE